ncbi:hypothetical protein LTR99_008746 [Exophiala xenobiotica]|uniref:Major facilitator superfamily (MFS) profile domain-containing protein n=1 Tax=Vermiconidia calcicola TaxID=1690605 RepID=A0AAV9Q0P2_9PEZI|nr:hypothetical protein LTR96_009016 [Exophiala xenobiotica]KAK5296379.1 hypothetical protein LTR99_008746 [Exophiala xenobiotica]KAK5334432.1 hypothetical protein LTR98_009386 [Exophiala xenobiotica]KAK5533390.1 hypothetical protein LTR25_007256 [Vermiconidia calcicola]KAK5542852.1 hypothetical protein LTR23_005177 [Chaetothyriales sp. CCFEE 6169]
MADAFTYPLVSSILNCLAVVPVSYLVDKIGRRYSLTISYFSQAFWIHVLAVVGGMAHKASTQKNVVVAAFILFSTSHNAFVTNFTIPYMIADIHFGVGWVFGSVSFGIIVFFLLPPRDEGSCTRGD